MHHHVTAFRGQCTHNKTAIGSLIWLRVIYHHSEFLGLRARELAQHNLVSHKPRHDAWVRLWR